MKNPFMILTVAAATMIFAACDKNNDNNPPDTDGGFTSISGTIQNMPSEEGNYILKLSTDKSNLSFAECPVTADGKFTLELPESIPSDQLSKIAAIPGLTISNPVTKTADIYLILYDGERDLDEVIYMSLAISGAPIYAAGAHLCYSDSDCEYKGLVYEESEEDETIQVPVTVELSFVKGWNWFVMGIGGTSESPTHLYTTKIYPGMRWFLDDDLEL